MNLRERITEIAEDFERKARDLRVLQARAADMTRVGSSPLEAIRLGDKASTYEYEARVLRQALSDCSPEPTEVE